MRAVAIRLDGHQAIDHLVGARVETDAHLGTAPGQRVRTMLNALAQAVAKRGGAVNSIGMGKA